MKPHSLPQSWLPWLLFLPLALMAWPGPGAPLADDPFPHLGGTGLVTLAILPAALWLSVAGRARPLDGLRALFLIWGFVTAFTWMGSPTDPFESRRAWLHMGNCLLLFAAGAQLDTDGRRCLNRGLVVFSILWSSAALWATAEGAYAGVLGNSGVLSQAALPGAVIGAWYVVSRRGLYWTLGLFCFALFLAHAALSPVLAGGIAMLFVLLLSCFISPWAKRKEQVRRRLGVLAALSVFTLFGVSGIGGKGTEETAEANRPAAAEDQGDLGGVKVRLMIWGSLPEILLDKPLFGLGPGQFQAAYPPYRNPEEIEASRGSDPNAADSFVNHAHNDLVQGLAELGLLAGSLWLLFLALVLRASLRGLAQTDFPVIASAAAALSLLMAALFNAPLSMNPAASAMAFMLFGAVASRQPASAGLQPTRPWRRGFLALALVGIPSAWSMLSFGYAFSDHVRANRNLLELEQAGGGPELNQLFLDALAARKRAISSAPGSAPSRFGAARASKGQDQITAWEAALEVRPHSVEALGSLGVLKAKGGDVDGARAAWKRALELSPSQPAVLENMARLEILEGELEAGKHYLERRLPLGALRPGLERWFGAQLVLRGAWAEGTPLLLGQAFEAAGPTEINASYLALRKSGPELEVDALRCLSQLLWAREHTAAGNYEVALRSYAHALRPTRKLVRNGADVLRAELAAAHFLGGDPKVARLEALTIKLSEVEWQSLPQWAREAISSAGLLEGR